MLTYIVRSGKLNMLVIASKEMSSEGLMTCLHAAPLILSVK